MIGPIKTVGIYVEDQTRAVEFYTRKLGFVLRRNVSLGPEASWIEVSPVGAQSSFVLYPKSMMPEWPQLKPSVVFHCADVEAECERLESLDVTITMPATPLPWGTFAKFADPDGNEFGLTSQEIAT